MTPISIQNSTIKPGVDASRVTRELSYGLDVAKDVYAAHGQPFTITSIGEGVHLPNSKHYIGQAGDLRTRDVDPAAVPAIAAELRGRLGSDYTVIIEGGAQPHIHVQYNGVGTFDDGGAAETVADLPAASPGVDLNAIFDDLGLPGGSGTVDAGIGSGAMIGLAVAGLFGLAYVLSD